MDLPVRATLPKGERLYGKKDISELLARRNWLSATGVKCCFRTDNGTGVNRLMVSVPKKLFKRAVLRNRLKRRLRESYRRQKDLLPPEGGIDLLLTYSTPVELPYGTLYDSVGSILKAISEKAG